jgi:putative transposase
MLSRSADAWSCRKKADGVIDRSKACDTPSVPLTVIGRCGVGNTRCGNHLGQRPYAVAPKGRTYGSKRSDQNSLLSLLQEGAVHIWNRFGPLFAADIRRQRVNEMRGYRQWRWHLDEMYVKLSGEMVYLWRAIDHEGEILESYVTKTRDKSAALAFMKKALKRHGSPAAIVTDGLRSYPAAMRQLGILERREVGRWKNNRAENSHLPFRRRERAMLRFRRMKTLQKFASVHANVQNHFNTERHLVDRPTYKTLRSAALAEWRGLMA